MSSWGWKLKGCAFEGDVERLTGDLDRRARPLRVGDDPLTGEVERDPPGGAIGVDAKLNLVDAKCAELRARGVLFIG